MNKLQETIDRLTLLSEYNPKKGLNEWGEKDSKEWINIGVIPDGSPIGAGGDAYLMVDPKAPQEDNFDNFRYRHTTYNTSPDGTGKDIGGAIPTYKMEYLKIYPEYRDTYYGDLFLGRRKGEEGEQMHQEFISKLNTQGGVCILKHDSSVRITDGVIKKGKTNSWSNNSDIGIYFWGSKKIGGDQSNGQRYTYYCVVPLSDIYDFSTNLERFRSLRQALEVHDYCAQYWDDKTKDAIVVNTFNQTPIKAVRDNMTGKVYDANWEEIDMQVENKKPKGNFINEYKPNTCNNAELVSINEINAKTMLQRHGDSGFIVISPCRGFADFKLDPNDPQSEQKLSEINNQRIRQMISQIKSSGYSYTPVYGGFIENAGTEDEESVYERSFVIYNKKRDGSEGDMRQLVEFGQALAQEYNQDSFLVKARGEKPKYITQNGNVDMEFSGNTSFNDFSQEYFTDLHKNTDKYAKNNGRKPTRFSYVESYVNPAPQCYSERHVRSLNGEIFLSETSRRQKA